MKMKKISTYWCGKEYRRDNKAPISVVSLNVEEL